MYIFSSAKRIFRYRHYKIFTFYTSVAKGLSFKKRFLEMAGISLGIAVINFFIGFAIRKAFNVEV